MRKRAVVLCALFLGTGCGAAAHVHSDAALGRVVVYKNGVAYFEREAEIDDDELVLSVPYAMVDDMLKSLRVVDAHSGTAAPLAYPTVGKPDADGNVRVAIALSGAAPHRLKISYLAEAPAWKPSYRATVKDGAVELEGWAIVDNTSGEDWRGVKLGVASSSALSFRYDLRSVRPVAREMLESGDRFAQAPPIGGASYDGRGYPVVDDFGGEVLEQIDAKAIGGDVGRRLASQTETLRTTVARMREEKRKDRDVVATNCLDDKLSQLQVSADMARAHSASLGGAQTRGDDATASHELAILSVLGQRAEILGAEAQQCIGSEISTVGESSVAVTIDQNLPPDEEPIARFRTKDTSKGERQAESTPPSGSYATRLDELETKVASLKHRIHGSKARLRLLGYDSLAPDPQRASLERALRLRDVLIARGVPADRIEAVGAGVIAGRGAGVQIVEVSADAERRAQAGLSLLRDSVLSSGAYETYAPSEPVGSAHFEPKEPLSVEAGHSAMVSLVKRRAQGEIVYLFDPDSARGDTRFPFRALRFVNPTRSLLDSGPVTVFDERGFIGEGLTEPISAGGVAFVPFALDRQIVVERRNEESERIARILSARDGVFGAELRHARTARYTLYNRGSQAAVVYLRHALQTGYTLGQAPETREKLGGAQIFRVEVPPNDKLEVTVEETTPQQRTVDVHSLEGAAQLASFLRSPEADAALKQPIAALLEQSKSLAGLERQIATRRAQMGVFRERMNEVHAQMVTLNELKGADRLKKELEAKLTELGEQLSALTNEVVSLQQELFASRLRYDDALFRFTVEPRPEPAAISGR